MRHAPFFCEENAWHLAQDPEVVLDGDALTALERSVVFITNPARTVRTWAQRAGDPVVWDYHVVVFARARSGWVALDLDSTLAWAPPASAWLRGSFEREPGPPGLLPHFRVVDVPSLLATFASDRSHMRDAQGNATQPLPPWPAITCPAGPMTLPRYLDASDPIAGVWLDLQGMHERFDNVAR